MDNYNSDRPYVAGIISILFIFVFVFVVLFLCKIIGLQSVSWFLVFLPLWLPVCIMSMVVVIVFLYGVIKDKICSKRYITKDINNG